MNRLSTTLLLLFSWVILSKAQSVKYPIDASHSVISFSVGFAGGITSIDGRFDIFEGDIGYFDKSDQSTLSTTLTIDVNSINTGDKERDEDLKGAGFFNVEEFPTITFESKNIKKTKEGYVVFGTFSMLGKTSEEEIQFDFNHTPSVVWVFGEPRIAIEGTHQLDRTQYELPKRGWDNIIPSLGSMTLSNEVSIKLVIQGVGPSLSKLLIEKIQTEGVAAAVELYTTLEAKEGDIGTYSFGDRTLTGVIMQLNRNKNHTSAIQLGKFGTAKYKDSFRSWYGLALAHQGAGNIEKAISAYEQTIELNPTFDRAKAALEKLKE